MAGILDQGAVICGAGIGGLATCLALSKFGIPARVVEQAPEPRSIGGALILWSNATRVLSSLGIEELALKAGTQLDTVEFRDLLGNTLSTLPVKALSRRHGFPSLVIPRADLIDMLQHAAGASKIRYVWKLEGFAQTGDEISVRSTSGETLSAGLLVGADGLHSTVRRVLVGHQPPDTTDQFAWVGLAAYQHRLIPPGVAMATIGRGLRFWCAGLKGGRVYWYGIVRRDHGVESLTQLAQLFKCAHEPIPELIEHTPNDEVVVTEMQDRPPMAGWSKGPVALLGDAAHPMTPDLGQGACQALESALVLSRCVAAAGPVEPALWEYERQRLERVAKISVAARAVAMSSAVDDPLIDSLRRFSIASHLPWSAEAFFDWILGGGL